MNAMLPTKSRSELVEVLRNQSQMFTVYRERNGDGHFLEAVCGGFAMYERVIRMEPDEVVWIHENPAELARLAYEICHAPERFALREVAVVP